MPGTSMKRYLHPVLCALFTLGLASAAMAQSSLAYVNADRLIDEAPQSQAAIARIESSFAQRSQDIKRDTEWFRQQMNVLNVNANTMSSYDYEEKAHELEAFQRQLAVTESYFKSDYAEARRRELADIEATISRLIVDYAKRNNIDLVVQSAVYASGRVNITNSILSELVKLHNGQ